MGDFMQISVSEIKNYLFCPTKLYIDLNIDSDSKTKKINDAMRLKSMRTDANGLIMKNIRNLKGDVELKEIEKILFKDLEELINETIDLLEDENSEEKVNELIKKYKNEFELKTKIISLKIFYLNQNTGKEGQSIVDVIYPTTIYDYSISDNRLSGKIDKIEIIDGSYYPIILKESNPPIKGVWDNEALEIAVCGELIEKEFNVNVFTGFVDYVSADIRRPVAITSELKRGLFKVIDDIGKIKNGEIPGKNNMEIRKCMKCEYKYVCNDDI